MSFDPGERVLDTFWQHLQSAGQRALLLDYDGTLAPFRTERDQALPYPGVGDLLDALLATGQTRLIIISGRPVADLGPLLGLRHRTELWGCHGWERLHADGRYQIEPLEAQARRSLEGAAAWIRQKELDPQGEIKPVSVALHWRGMAQPAATDLKTAAIEAWQPLATQGGLELHFFDGGLELRCPGRNKGTAVRQILSELEPTAAVAYLGDDLTDEDAFEALGQRGLSVLVRGEFRPTAAGLWLRPPEELCAFLRRWQQKCPPAPDRP